MRVLFFGTFDQVRHPRVEVLIEGMTSHGFAVDVLNKPLGDSTDLRIEAASRVTAAVRWAGTLMGKWFSLARHARRVPTPDCVIVGYLGILDVFLARMLFRHSLLVLDHLAPAADTAADRGLSSWLTRLLQWVDRTAERVADVVMVDTPENGVRRASEDVLVVPVGASTRWFHDPERREGETMKVVWYGLYTPLQGASTIAEAIRICAERDMRFTMIGTGQEHELVREIVGSRDGQVDWLAWVDGEELPEIVAAHDVCLGIFGTSGKARRVVPNKVFQGAAAGCSVVTSDTVPQRRAFGNSAVLVPPGNGHALAEALRGLQEDERELLRRRRSCHTTATEMFSPHQVVTPLVERVRR